MKHFATIIFFSLIVGVCKSQTKTPDSSIYSETIRQQALTMGELLLKKDFKAFTKFVYPKLTEMMGGELKMAEILEKGSSEMESKGITMLTFNVGQPSKYVSSANELQCTLPQTIEIKVPQGRLVTKATLIAISIDDGKNWYFVDTSGKDIETVKRMLPNLSGDLVIPEKQEPVFYKD